jgi:hypothetical protein
VPESSGIEKKFLQSPLLSLASYQGFNTDPGAPKWARIEAKRPILFRQPRGAMSEVFSALAWWEDNYIIVGPCSDKDSATPALTKHSQKALSTEAIQWALATAVVGI